MSMLCVIIPKDHTITFVTNDIMETDEIVQVVYKVFCLNSLVLRLAFYF